MSVLIALFGLTVLIILEKIQKSPEILFFQKLPQCMGYLQTLLNLLRNYIDIDF